MDYNLRRNVQDYVIQQYIHSLHLDRSWLKNENNHQKCVLSVDRNLKNKFNASFVQSCSVLNVAVEKGLSPLSPKIYGYAANNATGNSSSSLTIK